MSRACALALLATVLGGCKAAKLARLAEGRQLRLEASGSGGPPVVVIGIDGIDRSLLYSLFWSGALPGLASLVGDGRHVHLDESLISVLPSSTIPAWASMWTGAPPAEHGAPGNEIWVRERQEFVALAPSLFDPSESMFALYARDTGDRVLAVPTVWQRLRAQQPLTRIWVSLAQFHAGADRLLIADSRIVKELSSEALEAVVGGSKRDIWAQIDEEAVNAVLERLDRGSFPDVLALYLPGADLYAHTSARGPFRARRDYLTDVLDPLFALLAKRIRGRDAWVIIVSDHGHTQVLPDDEHALDEEPARVLRRAGFRVRRFKRKAKGPFDAVLGYQGFMAYVYLADRSIGDWRRPPRFEEDVLAAADAFARSEIAPHLEMILARRPRPYPARDEPFQVWEEGRLVPVEDWLRRHPHPEWVALSSRLRDLAAGTHGERAGDLVLVAHVGDTVKDRWYFGRPYYSQHGSPTRRDSEIPLIVAHPRYTSAEIGSLVHDVLGDRPRQGDVAALILRLRSGAHPTPRGLASTPSPRSQDDPPQGDRSTPNPR